MSYLEEGQILLIFSCCDKTVTEATMGEFIWLIVLER